MDTEQIEKIFLSTIEQIIGANSQEPLGGIKVVQKSENRVMNKISDIFMFIIRDEKPGDAIEEAVFERMKTLYQEAKDTFVSFYSIPENTSYLNNKWDEFSSAKDDESRARVLTEIWVPELTLQDNDIISRWRLSSVKKNPVPLKPEQVTIQMNALYTLPALTPDHIPDSLKEEWEKIKLSGYTEIANYDHPVAVFADDNDHELINCLDELNNDMQHEKTAGVFSEDYTLLVLISVSVTHDALDGLASKWIEWLLRNKKYNNLQFILLSESNVLKIKERLIKKDIPVFSVFGKYAKHFNALKYMQLLLEKSHGILAGFKIDTDEGIHSEDLYKARGKTWFQILCHDLWGGTAVDCHGKQVALGINEGEYIRGTDIDEFGYSESLRRPEVPLPESFISSQIFFNKPYAQGKGTELYNRFNSLDDAISHPIVKGGGYGITNDTLKKCRPFTLSEVGRAEDQQFYFYGLTRGLRGIFHPDLRIAHYKSTVAKSEKKNAATKIMGDMYRLIIFEHLVSLMGIKYDIDPFPGLFAGKLAKAQAFFNILYRAYDFCIKGEDENAEYLLNDGFNMLDDLKKQIESGQIKEMLSREEKEWEEFVDIVDRLKPDDVSPVIAEMII